MALGRQARNQRGSPRVDVLLRVKGELVPVGFPVTIFNLNRTGVSVLSKARFRPGDRLNFRLTAVRGPSVVVTAAAVHTQSLPHAPDLYLTGFMFAPERPGDPVPERAIRQLIAAVAPVGFKI
jgi:hypothetical protein